MKRIAKIVIIIFFIIIMSLPASAQVTDPNNPCTMPLIAGKENIISGDSAGTVAVRISDDPNMLIVEFTTHDGWVLQETHLYVGDEPPETSAPGRFPYKHDPVANPDEDTYYVDLGAHGLNLGNNNIIYFAAHAAMQWISPDGYLVEEESAWALGDPIPNKSKNWAMYFMCTGDGGENGGGD